MRAVMSPFSLGTVVLALASIGACSSEGVVGSLAGKNDGGADGAVVDEEGGTVAPLAPVTNAIAAGGASTCVKTMAGEVKCWGENGTGSLGIGDTEPPSSATPVSPSPLGKVRFVAAGERAHCAMGTNTKVYCWGDIFIGDFNGQPIDHLPAPSPFSIEASGEIASVAVGRYFTCLLGASGDVRCFGLNDKGQLGVGSTDKQYLPTTVNGLDGPVTSLSASMGGLFVCATTHPGSVYCWGDGRNGQFGGERGVVTTPRKVDGLTNRAAQVVAGGSHVCARLYGGAVQCWGSGDRGQLGDGLKQSSASPVATLYLTDVVTLAAGQSHTCAARREGTVFCWGDDTEGQVGGIPDPSRPSLVRPASFGAQLVTCGLAHSCAWAPDGRMECWGSNSRAQLGPGKATF